MYHLGAGDYARLLAAQGGFCAICRRARGLARRLSVDHDHITEEVRGLLCMKCNDMLGHAHDSIEFFVRVIGYLTHPPAREVLDPGACLVGAESHLAEAEHLDAGSGGGGLGIAHGLAGAGDPSLEPGDPRD